MSLLSSFLANKRTDLEAAVKRLHAACADVDGVDLTASGATCTIGRQEIKVYVTRAPGDEGGYELNYQVSRSGFTTMHPSMRLAVDAFASEIVKAEQE